MYSNINKQKSLEPPLSMRISDENSKKNNYSPPTPTSQLRRVLRYSFDTTLPRRPMELKTLKKTK